MMVERAVVGALVLCFLALLALKVSFGSAAHSTGLTQRFESTTVHDREGYWGPATATIDWCEHNYVVSYYVAEFYNTVSNTLLVLSGSHCIWQTIRYKWDLRFAVAGLVIALTGVGSAAYHSTLQYCAQMWDEVPMVWAVLVFVYINLRMADGLSIRLAAGLASYGICWTVVHGCGAYVVLFQLHFGVLVMFALYLTCRVLRRECHTPILPLTSKEPLHPSRRNLRFMVWVTVAAAALAFLLWVTDQVACDTLHHLPGGIPNPQLHAWWHVLLGVACHFLLQSVIVMRHAVVTKSLPASRWILGGFLCFAVPPNPD